MVSIGVDHDRGRLNASLSILRKLDMSTLCFNYTNMGEGRKCSNINCFWGNLSEFLDTPETKLKLYGAFKAFKYATQRRGGKLFGENYSTV